MKTEWTGPVGRLLDFPAIRQDGGPHRSKAYELIAAGELEAVKVGTRTKITGRSWEAYKQALPRGLSAPVRP
jgi:hypothetical protein